jgi:hypothetical protein
MKNANLGENLNKMSMATEEKDDDDVFFDNLDEGLRIAMALIKTKKSEDNQPGRSLIPASNKLALISIDSILK